MKYTSIWVVCWGERGGSTIPLRYTQKDGISWTAWTSISYSLGDTISQSIIWWLREGLINQQSDRSLWSNTGDHPTSVGKAHTPSYYILVPQVHSGVQPTHPTKHPNTVESSTPATWTTGHRNSSIGLPGKWCTGRVYSSARRHPNSTTYPLPTVTWPTPKLEWPVFWGNGAWGTSELILSYVGSRSRTHYVFGFWFWGW